MESEKRVVLVTGGSGLVGSGIKEVVEEEARPNETWIFLSSKVDTINDTCHLFFSLFSKKQLNSIITHIVSTGCQSPERERD